VRSSARWRLQACALAVAAPKRLADFQRQAEASLALLQSGNIVSSNRNMQQLVNTFVPLQALPSGCSEPIESSHR